MKQHTPAALPQAARMCIRCLIRFTLYHSPTLAIHRHYTFYLWKDVLGRSAALRRWLAPVYVVSGAAVWRQLAAAQPPLWAAAWAACTAAVLVPTALLEFRWGPLIEMRSSAFGGVPTVAPWRCGCDAGWCSLHDQRSFLLP